MKKVLLTTLFILFYSTITWAESVTLAWDANSESDLAGYKMYVGNVSGTYTSITDVTNVTQYEVLNLIVGTTYYFAVTAYDTSANESGYSNEISTTITDIILPGIPSNLRIITITQ
ncbi:hypothetical protein LCGC14_1662690 [marine sediment metagenome]|uniref:Fibronectin type-III domain-containing protein n=1 Tax=marine sediment metagenome TaxID=412755 RepID=A0A0F9HTM8_9ZZZZ